jgi:hypothetical protein
LAARTFSVISTVAEGRRFAIRRAIPRSLGIASSGVTSLLFSFLEVGHHFCQQSFKRAQANEVEQI